MKTRALQPIVSEKTMALTEQNGTYTFAIPTKLNKIEAAVVIAEQFTVKVKSVNIANVRGKAKTAIVKRGRKQLRGERTGYKKAYVTLIKGESIKLFDEPKPAKKKPAVSKKEVK